MWLQQSKALIFFLFFSCALTVKRPNLEMAFAKAAYDAAKRKSAIKFSPQLFRKAELSYIKAQALYRKKFFDKAKKLAKMTIYYAERAEFDSIKKQAFQEVEDEEF